MKEDTIYRIIILMICFLFIVIVASLLINNRHPEFGTAICKESHYDMGVCSRFGCTGGHTDYYLIDENHNKLETTKEIYDSLALPGCTDTTKEE